MAIGRGVRVAQDADRQAAGDQIARRAGARRPRISRRILAAVKDGKAPINDKTKPLLEIIAKYTNLPVEQVVGNCAYIDPDGKLDVNNVDNQIKWLQEQGFVDKGFEAEAIIARDYVKAD